MFNLQIPVDGSSVPVEDFPAAAKAAFANLPSGLTDEELGQAKAAIDHAIAIVKDGHAGRANVLVVVGGIANPDHAITPITGSLFSLGIYQRPTPAKPVPAPEPPPAAPRRSPYETGATEAEIAREAANTGKTPEQVRKALGAPTPGGIASPAEPAAKPAPIRTGATKGAASAPKVAQAKPQSAKPARGSVEKQVAKDRAGK